MANRKIVITAALLLSVAALKAQNVSVSTNLLSYLEMGTLSLNASYGLSRHFTMDAGGKYNSFVFKGNEGIADQKQSKQRLFYAGVKYWPWHIHSGWWLMGKGQFQEFNKGGITEAMTREGDRLGIGLSGGYTYMLSTHLNLEVGGGIWGGREEYTVYACPKCGKILDSGTKHFALPNDMLLGLVFVF